MSSAKRASTAQGMRIQQMPEMQYDALVRHGPQFHPLKPAYDMTVTVQPRLLYWRVTQIVR